MHARRPVSYRIRYSDEAKRTLAMLPGRYRQRARRMIEELARNPQPARAEQLRDYPPGVFRVWLNGWRIIYQVNDEAGILWIAAIRLKVGPETYEGLDVE